MRDILDLNSKVVGKEVKNYEPITAGVYDATVEEIGSWKAKEFVDALINKKGDDGLVVKDESGKIEKVKETFTAYSADIKLKIVGGDFDGRYVFANVTTHPDVIFLLDQFIFATVGTCVLSDLQEKAIGANIRVNVGIKEYPKTTVDPNTALETVTMKTKNYVRGFYKSNIVNDLGI